MEKNIFADRLCMAMKIKNIKPRELSEKTGIAKSSISEYQNGKYQAKSNAVHLIANALNINESWLLGYDVPMEKISKEVTAIPIIKNEYNNSKCLLDKNYIGYIYMDSTPNEENYFAITISDTSMEPLFSLGDTAIVHKQTTFESGDTCLLQKDNKLLIRKVIKEDDTIKLIPMNSNFETISYNTNNFIKILGKVIEARKKLF